ncbi:MAG: NrtA/SsuA/CpmA family ABC transporter substrate-binding protein, partial [Patescibacteria group bacterium]
MNKKIFTIFIIGLVVVLGVSWFFIKDKEQEEEYEGPVEKVSIATPPGFFSSIVWIAKEKGYFEKHGLEVDIVEQDVGEEGFSKVLEGDIDIAFIAHTPIAKQSLGRDDFAIFASLATSSDDMKIIARKGDGILKAEDLKGKKIGIPDASTARFFLSYFLLNNNLSHSDIEKVYYLPSELPGALKAGEVDAIAIREPFIGISKQFIDEEIVKLSDYHTHE